MLYVLFALLVLVQFSYIGRDVWTYCNAYCCIKEHFMLETSIFIFNIQLFLFRTMLTVPLLTDRPISLARASSSRPVGILLITQVGCAKVNVNSIYISIKLCCMNLHVCSRSPGSVRSGRLPGLSPDGSGFVHETEVS